MLNKVYVFGSNSLINIINDFIKSLLNKEDPLARNWLFLDLLQHSTNPGNGKSELGMTSFMTSV